MTKTPFPHNPAAQSFRFTRTGFFLLDEPECSEDSFASGLSSSVTPHRFFVLDGGVVALLVTAALALIGCALGKN